MHPNEIKKITRYSPFVVMGAIALFFSAFITVVTTQQNQDNRSKAAIVNGDYNGSLTTNSNIINGSVNGDVIGSSNTISGNVSGCVKGSNNIIGGRVSGAVTGTGNIIALGSGSGPCIGTQSTSETVTLTPIADAVVYQSSGSSNHGTKVVLEVETESGGTDYSYLKFDLRPYAGKTITSAKLRVRTNGDSDAGSTGTTSVKVVSDISWSETGITYNNRPTISSTVLGTLNPRSSNTVYESTLSASGLQYSVGNLFSIGLTNPTDDAVTLHSRESSYDPELVITFAQTSSPTQAPTQSPSATQTPTATTAPSATPVPTATPTPLPGVTVTAAPTVTQTPTAVPTYAPTATIAPGNTTATVTIFAHGVGKGGDAVNPNANGNANPKRLQRAVKLDFYNATNELVAAKEGTVTYEPTSGTFKGTIDLGANVTTGVYTIKVKMDQYLRVVFPGIHNITKGVAVTLPAVKMIVGDVNNDNAINIVDYNILVGCYSDLLPPVSCNDVDAIRADLNDDSFVNQFDYNLFIRELTNIGGQ